MTTWKCKNIQIRKYTNIHVEKYKCEKCQRVCKESKYIYKKPSKEKTYKNNKHIEMCTKTHKKTHIYEHENI